MLSNADLWIRREAAIPRGVASAIQVFAARAENAELRDVEGRSYIDFAGGHYPRAPGQLRDLHGHSSGLSHSG